MAYKFKILFTPIFFLSFYFLQVGRNAFNERDVVCEFFAEFLLEKIAELLRGKYCEENFAENIRGGKLFFNGQFTKIQAIKSSLQQRFTPIAGLALAILCFVENNLVETILSF